MIGVAVGFVVGSLALAAFYGWLRRLPVPPITEAEAEDHRQAMGEAA